MRASTTGGEITHDEKMHCMWKRITQIGSTDKCSDCCRKAVRELFKQYPDVEKAFHESIEEMKKPENRKKMVDDTCRFMTAIQNLQKQRK